MAVLSTPSFALFDELRQQLATDTSLTETRVKATAEEDGWTLVDDLILKDGKIFVLASYKVVPSVGFGTWHGS